MDFRAKARDLNRILNAKPVKPHEEIPLTKMLGAFRGGTQVERIKKWEGQSKPFNAEVKPLVNKQKRRPTLITITETNGVKHKTIVW